MLVKEHIKKHMLVKEHIKKHNICMYVCVYEYAQVHGHMDGNMGGVCFYTLDSLYATRACTNMISYYYQV
jgi:hypothetical protein